MFHIRSNIEEQKSDMNVLTEIVKNMKVPDGILNHVLETHKDNYGKDYHYDVCEFLAETIDFSCRGSVVYLPGIDERIMDHTNLLLLKVCESRSLISLGLAGRFNDQRNAELARDYSAFLTSFCKVQSKIISEKGKEIVFGNASNIYSSLFQNKNESIRDEYHNILDPQIKDTYAYLARKHEFILNNFSYLREILVRYFEKRKSTEDLIYSAYRPYDLDVSKSEDSVLDKLNMLNKCLNHTNNVNHGKIKGLITEIQKGAIYLDWGPNPAIKKILVTKMTGPLKNRLENLL